MKPVSWLQWPSVQVLLGLGLFALLGWYVGKWALLLTSPLLGALLARPLLALSSSWRHALRALVWRQSQGRHFVYKTVTLRVQQDADHYCWVALADVQTVVGPTASARALGLAYPQRLQLMGQPAQMYIREDALIAHLSKENLPAALRFRTWLERNIAAPARRTRSLYGIR